MTRVYFSTVHRGGPAHASGEFVCVDWDTKTVVAQRSVSAASVDANPRGGTRGGRGMWATDTVVYAADRRTVYKAAPDFSDWTPMASGLRDLHEMCLDSGTLWCAETQADTVVGIDVTSGSVVATLPWARTQPNYLNAVAVWDGRLLAMLSRSGTIVDMNSGQPLGKVMPRSHDLVVQGNSAFVASTRSCEVVEINLSTKRPITSVSLRSLPWVSALEGSVIGTAVASPLFARGLNVVGTQVYVGLSPAAVVCIDWPSGRMIDAFQYSQDVDVAVHGLSVSEGS